MCTFSLGIAASTLLRTKMHWCLSPKFRANALCRMVKRIVCHQTSQNLMVHNFFPANTFCLYLLQARINAGRLSLLPTSSRVSRTFGILLMCLNISVYLPYHTNTFIYGQLYKSKSSSIQMRPQKATR